MQQQAVSDEKRGNVDDVAYDAFVARIGKRFFENVGGSSAPIPVFTTDVSDLWDAYLSSFPPAERQFHNCNACRSFIEHFGGLVTIDPDHGATSSAIWDVADSDGTHSQAIENMESRVLWANITGVFFSSEETWGRPVTGRWTHFAISPPKSLLFNGAIQTPHQAMAEKREDFKNVKRALAEFDLPTVLKALSLLNSEALYRSEKVIGPAQWLANLHAKIAKFHGPGKENLIWRAVAMAPAGFCHPRSSMVGTLLEDIQSGMEFSEVSRRFREKMNPLQYQRPQAAPSAGNIAQAEKVIAQLRAAGSLERRFARKEEVQPLWLPLLDEPENAGGVFGHLKSKGQLHQSVMNVPSQKVTWEKFARDVLPGARQMELNVPLSGQFSALVTALHPDSPPIIQWDQEERRNPFSWYLYPGGSHASRWGLRAGAWCPVTVVTLQPSMWYTDKFKHQGEGALFLLEGAKDENQSGNALFPEILKAEFHAIRSTIEAYSKTAELHARPLASACGVKITKGSQVNARLRITDGTGNRFEYLIDRWE